MPSVPNRKRRCMSDRGLFSSGFPLTQFCYLLDLLSGDADTAYKYWSYKFSYVS